MKKTSIAILAGLVAAFASCQEAKICQKPITLNTYPFSDPNPVANPGSPFYPYHTFDGYAHQGQPQEWQAVELENKYVKVTILPEIGGKIWGAVEKSTGNEFIYFNHSVKFRNIAMRGPWTSGGIEANFGIIGHAPTCSTPVDYTTRKNPDGSVSCFIGSLDMLTSTWWSVEVRLDADKSYFTTTTSWNNSSPLEQPLYHWMNAGYKATDDMKFYFPGDTYIGHNGEVAAWPTDEQGRDLSSYARHNFGNSKSMHVTGGLGDYFGAYWENSDFGTVHHSDYDQKLGMKIFIWGLSREGMIWEDLLTDTDGQYLEMQSGRMFNQASPGSNLSPYKHIGLAPYTTDNWNEYWYPVKETGGISQANERGVLYVKRNNETLSLKFCPTGAINEKITVWQDGKAIFEGHIKGSALQTWSKQLNINSAQPLKAVIGESLMVWNEDPASDLVSRPKFAPEGFDWQSVYGLYLNGKLLMDEKKYTQAKPYLEHSVERDSNFAPALNQLAVLYFRMGNYSESIRYSRRALSINTYDPEANYIYGLANDRLGRMNDAKDGFSVAAQSPSHREAAYIELTRLAIKEGNYLLAKEYSAKSLLENCNNQTAMLLEAVVARKLDKKDKVTDIAKNITGKYPLNHFALFELYAIQKSESAKKQLTGNIKNELPYQTFLEMAGWYSTMGCDGDAISLLELSPKNAIVLYRLAYLYNKQGNEQKAGELLKEAGESSLEFMFPFRAETSEALAWAASMEKSWSTQYLLALNLWAMGNVEQARGLLDACGDKPDYAPFYLTRALLDNSTVRAEDLKAAEKIDKSWRVGLELLKYYNQHKLYAEALATGEQYTKLYPDNYLLGLKYAYAMMKAGEYEKCIDYMKQIKVLPNEGASEGRTTYRDANLLLAIESIKAKDFDKASRAIEQSKEYLENLGVGKPYDDMIDMRSTDFITAQLHMAMGDKAKAQEFFLKVANGNRAMNSNMLLTALSELQCVSSAAASKTIQSVIDSPMEPQVAQYCKYRFMGNKAMADQALRTMKQVQEVAPWESSVGDSNIDLVKSIADAF